jgi:hypothetical protein
VQFLYLERLPRGTHRTDETDALVQSWLDRHLPHPAPVAAVAP